MDGVGGKGVLSADQIVLEGQLGKQGSKKWTKTGERVRAALEVCLVTFATCHCHLDDDRFDGCSCCPYQQVGK